MVRASRSSIRCFVAGHRKQFVAFGILWLNGKDLRNTPLIERKRSFISTARASRKRILRSWCRSDRRPGRGNRGRSRGCRFDPRFVRIRLTRESRRRMCILSGIHFRVLLTSHKTSVVLRDSFERFWPTQSELDPARQRRGFCF
jgi:hypothetical protein